MEAIARKIKADIVSHALVSVLIVTTVMAASVLLTLALATLMNISAPYDRTFQELNGAHLWLYFDRGRLRPGDVRRIESLPEVVGSTGVRYSVVTRVRIGDTRVVVSLRAEPPAAEQDGATVNRLLLLDGRYFAPRRMEVLAGQELRDRYHLAVGDEAEVTRWDGRKVTLPVVGLVYNPMWDTYRSSQPPYLYVSETTLRALFPDDEVWDRSLGLRLADPEAVGAVVAHAEALVRPDTIVAHTDWRDVRESATFGMQLNSVFLGSFGFFAILAAVLVIATSIGARVLSQFRQIGILKAIGFTQAQVLWLYLGQYLILGLAGGLLGLAVGGALAPLPLRSVAASLSTVYRTPVNGVLMAAVIGAVLVVVLLAAWGAARRGAQVNIVTAIATGAEPPRTRWPGLIALATRLRLPMVFILGLNDLLARPLRSLLTGLNLTLGVIGVIFGLSLNGTLHTYETNPALLGIVYDAVVTRETLGDSRVRGMLRRAPGVEAFYAECLVEVETPQGRSFTVRAVDGDLSAFPFDIADGRMFFPNTNEALAGRGLLNWLGLTVGDELIIRPKEGHRRASRWVIVGQYPEPANAGQMLMLSLPTARRHLGPVEPRTYYLRLAPDVDREALRRYLSPRADSDLEVTFVKDAIPESVVYLRLAIFALAGVLIGIALVNVFNTSLLAVQERLRVIGVLKTLGMTPFQVVTMVNTTAGVLGLLAAVVGIPLGLAFTKMTMAALAQTYGFGPVRVTLNVLYGLALPPVMVVVSTLGSVVPGVRAARLSIVEVLRNE